MEIMMVCLNNLESPFNYAHPLDFEGIGDGF